MTAPAPVGLLRRLVARAMTAGPAAPSPEHPRPEPGTGRDASAALLLRSAAESHLSWFAAAAAASRPRSARTPHPADPAHPAGLPAGPDADRGRPADRQAEPASWGSHPEAGGRPVPTALDAASSEVPAPPNRSPRAAGPPTADRRVSLGPLRAEQRAAAARPDGPEQSAAVPPAAAPAHPAPRRRAPGADLGPVAGPEGEPGSGPQAPGRATRPAGPGPHPADRAADTAAAAPPLPPAVVLLPRPGDPAHGAPSPAAHGRAGRRGRAAEAPAPAPVVVRIGRVELVVAPAAAAPAPAAPSAPAAPAADRHPDLLAAHRRHGGGWPG
ncbi:hypothetical protein [Kitasatospora sp. NPDC085464]|uniref:hypothetical protein n=1 Tax=Kitasatospora sp. NPDC085464 TaxID=3364063 RepID=UPI0037CA6645